MWFGNFYNQHAPVNVNLQGPLADSRYSDMLNLALWIPFLPTYFTSTIPTLNNIFIKILFIMSESHQKTPLQNLTAKVPRVIYGNLVRTPWGFTLTDALLLYIAQQSIIIYCIKVCLSLTTWSSHNRVTKSMSKWPFIGRLMSFCFC